MENEKEMQSIRATALKFLEAVAELTIENISHYIKANTAYSVYFYKENDEMIKDLELTEEIKNRNGFVYTSKSLRCVFINALLSGKEKIEILIHEIGHVILDRDILTENDKEINAHIFSYFVLKYGYKNIFSAQKH